MSCRLPLSISHVHLLFVTTDVFLASTCPREKIIVRSTQRKILRFTVQTTKIQEKVKKSNEEKDKKR